MGLQYDRVLGHLRDDAVKPGAVQQALSADQSGAVASLGLPATTLAIPVAGPATDLTATALLNQIRLALISKGILS